MYSAASDPYCYPDSDVLRNKADLRDADQLAEFETAMTMIRAAEALPEGPFDYPHYLAIHRHLFQDVYDWAGSPRTVRLSKGGNTFCYPEYIEGEMMRLFSELAAENFFTGLSKEAFAGKAAHFLAEINAVHAFREGNGRTQLTFLVLLSENAGHELNMDRLDADKMLSAMIRSFSGDEGCLAELILTLMEAP